MKHLSEIELKQAFDRWYMAPKLRLPPVNKLNPLEAFRAGARWRESVGPDGEMFKQFEENKEE